MELHTSNLVRKPDPNSISITAPYKHASYASGMVKKEMTQLKWNEDSEQIHHHIFNQQWKWETTNRM
jgi:hypothetical protein